LRSIISSKDQLADGFTKALPVKAFEEFKHNLNLKESVLDRKNIVPTDPFACHISKDEAKAMLQGATL
jgi:hypothetical protein